MKTQWQNNHFSEESIPKNGGGPTAREPPEDSYHVMEGRLVLITEAQETVADLPRPAAEWITAGETDFEFDQVRVVDWGLMNWPGSPHGGVYFDVEVWADRPHRTFRATYERHEEVTHDHL